MIEGENSITHIEANKDNIAKINISEINADEDIDISGGKVELAYATIKGRESYDKASTINITAGVPTDELGTGKDGNATSEENVLSIDDSTIDAVGDKWDAFSGKLGHINLNGGKIYVNNLSYLSATGDIRLGDKNIGGRRADIEVSGSSSMEAGRDVSMSGNTIDISQSGFYAHYGKLNIEAAKDVSRNDDVNGTSTILQAATDNTVNIANTALNAEAGAEIAGGKIDITDTILNSPFSVIVAANEYRRIEEDGNRTLSTVSEIGNTIRLNNIEQNITGDDGSLVVMGGKIDVAGYTTTAPNVYLGAGKSLTFNKSNGDMGFTYAVDEDPSLITIGEEGQIRLNENNVNVYKTTVAYEAKGAESENSGTDKSGTDQPDIDRPGAEQPGIDAPGMDNSTPVNPNPTHSNSSSDGHTTVTPASVNTPVIPAYQNGGNAPQSVDVPTVPRSEARLQETAQFIPATPTDGEINQTVHQELDQAVKVSAPENVIPATDVPEVVSESTDTTAHVVVEEKKKTEQE